MAKQTWSTFTLGELNAVIHNNGIEVSHTRRDNSGRERIYIVDADGDVDYFATEQNGGEQDYQFTCSYYENKYGKGAAK